MMLRRAAHVVLAASFAVVSLGAVADARLPYSSYYLTPSQIDLSQLLEPPPDPGSSVAREDVSTMASVEAQRTQADLDAAQSDKHRTVFSFTEVLGPQFVSEKLPLTTALFAHTSGDTEVLVAQAKAYFDRPRPQGARQTHGSYPSGHAAFAACTAILLSAMVPEKRDAIFARAEIFADRRIVAGVHYPTDVEAGWIAGTIVAYALLQQPLFIADFKAARAEVRSALGYRSPATTGSLGTFGKAVTSKK
jgi:acid phosphatase (class A)